LDLDVSFLFWNDNEEISNEAREALDDYVGRMLLQQGLAAREQYNK